MILSRTPPYVAMSQNLLPFEPAERARFGLSLTRLRLKLLQIVQTRTMQGACGLIFLTSYAANRIHSSIDCIGTRTTIIPHGVDSRFRLNPRPTLSPSTYSFSRPFKLLYVSDISPYKHQVEVVRAISNLRAQGIPLALDLVGPAYAPYLKRVERLRDSVEAQGKFITYKGQLTYSEMHLTYHRSDAFLFASTCENLPNVILEAMASGLPIASSSAGPMPEILGDAAVYFDANDAGSISQSIHTLFSCPELRARIACGAYERSLRFSWRNCSDETFGFIANVVNGK